MASSNIMPSSPVEQERTNLLSDGDDLLHYSKKVTGKPHSGAKYCRKRIGKFVAELSNMTVMKASP